MFEIFRRDWNLKPILLWVSSVAVVFDVKYNVMYYGETVRPIANVTLQYNTIKV